MVVGFAVSRMKFAPMVVLTHTLATGPVVAEVMRTGTLEARVKTTISPRSQERLAEVLVDQGDAVRNGQLLARLDDGELKMQVAGVIVVTHDYQALDVFDRVIEMEDGRVRAGHKPSPAMPGAGLG